MDWDDTGSPIGEVAFSGLGDTAAAVASVSVVVGTRERQEKKRLATNGAGWSVDGDVVRKGNCKCCDLSPGAPLLSIRSSASAVRTRGLRVRIACE